MGSEGSDMVCDELVIFGQITLWVEMRQHSFLLGPADEWTAQKAPPRHIFSPKMLWPFSFPLVQNFV